MDNLSLGFFVLVALVVIGVIWMMIVAEDKRLSSEPPAQVPQAECRYCGRAGFFVSLDSHGLCKGCQGPVLKILRRDLQILIESVEILGKTKVEKTFRSRIGVARGAIQKIREMALKGIVLPEFTLDACDKLLSKLAEDEGNAAAICSARKADAKLDEKAPIPIRGASGEVIGELAITFGNPIPPQLEAYEKSKHDERKAECPYCHASLPRTPGRKFQCPRCSRFMLVRSRPDGARVVVTEEEAAAIDKQWAEFRDKLFHGNRDGG